MAGSYSPPPAADPADDMSGGAGGAGDPDAGAQPDGPSGYSIEIRVDGNNQISVCVEGGEDDDDAGAGAAGTPGAGADPDADADADAGGMSQYTPCKSIKEALTLALEIYRADGKMPQQADDDFQKGFDSQGATAS